MNPSTRVAVLAIAILLVPASARLQPAQAASDGSPTRLSAVASDLKPAPERSVKRQVAGRVKEPAKPSPGLERGDGARRDDPMLKLLWLLTGSSKRR